MHRALISIGSGEAGSDTTDNVDLEVADVKWFRMRSEKMDPEKKDAKVQQGDLKAGKGNANANDFSNGPEEFYFVEYT